MHDFVLTLSHAVDSSEKYQQIKAFLRALLTDVNYPYKKYFDRFMIVLIVLSISILMIGKSNTLPSWLVAIDLYGITAIFALEYLLRLWISDDIHKYIIATAKRKRGSKSTYYRTPLFLKLKYIFSLPALIDFIAIFPQFRIIRLLKLYHYMHGTSSLFRALTKKRFEFIFLGYILFGVTFTLGSIFYILEYDVNDAVGSYLDAIYWALVTISTVGYGDISPVTDLGKVVAMFGIVFGIAMISFVTSVMVSAFSERFDELRNSDSISHVRKISGVVIINGYGHLGSTIARKLQKHKKYEPVIIENDETRANRAIAAGHQVIRAEGSDASLIGTLCSRGNIVAMLTLTSSDIENIYFILNAKSVYAKSVIYARMNQPKLSVQYCATKVNGVIEPYRVVGDRALHYLKKHSKDDAKAVLFFGYTHKSCYLSQKLREADIEVILYETSVEHYEKAKREGFEQVVLVEDKQDDYLEYVRSLEGMIVVCAMDDEALNVYYSITLRSGGFKEVIVALSDSREDSRKLLLAGVSKVFDMYEESADRFVELVEGG